MDVDAGVFNIILKTYLDVFDSGVSVVTGKANSLLQVLVVLELTLLGLFWSISGSPFVGKFLKKVLQIGFFIWIIGNFSWLTGEIANGFIDTGAEASGAGRNILTNPGSIVEAGLNTARPLAQFATDNFSIWTSPIDTIAFGLMVILIVLAYLFLAITVLITRIEFGIVTTLGLILIPFGVFKPTSFIAERVFGGVIAYGIKLMVIAFIAGIGVPLLSRMVISPDPTWTELFVPFGGVFTILLLCLKAPAIAASLISGGPSLSAGAAIGSAVGAVGLGAAAGLAGASAAKGVGGGVVGAGRVGGRAGMGALGKAHETCSKGRSGSGQALSEKSAGEAKSKGLEAQQKLRADTSKSEETSKDSGRNTDSTRYQKSFGDRAREVTGAFAGLASDEGGGAGLSASIQGLGDE